MSYFQKHKRIAQEVDALSHVRNAHSRTLTQEAPKTKKQGVVTSRIADSRAEDDPKSSKTKEKEQKPHSIDTNRHNYLSSKQNLPHPLPRRQLPHPPQNPSLSKIQTMLNEADNSMQQLLNSSINQFSKYLERQPTEEHLQLVAQNQHLRSSLWELKNILREKLESALRKQKLEVTAMMEDYVQLITKLLKDKEELTASVEQAQQEVVKWQGENGMLSTQVQQLEAEVHGLQGRMQAITVEKQAHIAKTKGQIDDFLQIIDQYQEESEQESKQHEAMKARIHELEAQLKQQEQSPKLQNLIELLERSEDEKRQILSGSGWEERERELERQHEEEFIEYERAMRETIDKKDECIERLNLMIDSLKQRKHTRETSFQTTSDLPFN